MVHLLALPLVLLLQVPPAAPPGPGASTVVGGEGAPTVTIPRIDATIVVDGRLDEPAWAEARRLGHFWQYQPIDGRPASERTEVRVWYSPTAIYFGILAYDDDPGAIRATLPDRDNLDSEDTVTLFLDTFHDRRRAFFFTVNPLGVQQDGMHSEGGFNAGTRSGHGMDDKNPDFQFESKGRLTDDGYVVEVRIPFKTLRYPAGSAPQTWGLNIQRKVQRTGYVDTWTDVRRAGESFLAQAGAIAGLHDLKRGLVTEVQPVWVVAYNGSRASGGEPFVRATPDSKPGANLRFSTSNLTFDSTVNPDFSQVEADAAQVTVNERFALNYPEKRPFFLEGIDLFSAPNQLVYTRQIVDPIAGEKVTGKLGALNVAYLVTKERADNGRALSNIARVRRDFGDHSTLGAILTDREATGQYNRVVGVDERTIFKDLYYVQFQLANAWTGTADGQRLSSPLWMAELDRTGRAFGLNYKLTGIGSRFVAANGYVPRSDNVTLRLFNRYSWYFKKGSALETLQFHYNPTRLWRYGEFPDLTPLEGSDGLSLQSGWRGGWSLEGQITRQYWRLDPAAYTAYQVRRDGAFGSYLPVAEVSGWTPDLTFTTPIWRRFDGQIEAKRGAVPIFTEGSEGRETRVTSTLNARPTGSIRAQLTLTYSHIVRARDDSEFARTLIPRLKVEYQVTRALFFRVVGQYQSEREALLYDSFSGDPLVVGGEVPPATDAKGLRLDWLASYKPTPFTVAFFGYGASLTRDPALGLSTLTRTSDGFFLKLAYQFRW